jgi:hypothetical protein
MLVRDIQNRLKLAQLAFIEPRHMRVRELLHVEIQLPHPPPV